MSALNPSLTTATFNSSTTNISGGVPSGWASSVPLRIYSVYGGNNTAGGFVSDVNHGVLSAVQYPVVMYDLENWSRSPIAEQQNAPLYMHRFGDFAHAHGFQTIMAPEAFLVRVQGSVANCDDGQTGWQCFLSNGWAAAAARYSDRYSIQSQGQQTGDASGPDAYINYVSQASAQAKAANPQVVVSAGLSTNPPQGTPTVQVLYQDANSVRSYVSGFWLNVPDPALGSCPSCGAPRPDLALQLIQMLAGG